MSIVLRKIYSLQKVIEAKNLEATLYKLSRTLLKHQILTQATS